MRWDFMKKCWSMAKDSFPKDSIFVFIPPKLGMEGDCPIINIPTNKSLGKIEYQTVVIGGNSYVNLKLGDKEESIRLQKFAEISISPAKSIVKRNGANAPKAIAYIAIGRKITNLDTFLSTEGYSLDILDEVKREMFSLGHAVTGSKRRFQDMDRIRIKDPKSMEYNEGGRVVGYKKVNGKEVYLVIVDGSEEPVWFLDDVLELNNVGNIRPIMQGQE